MDSRGSCVSTQDVVARTPVDLRAEALRLAGLGYRVFPTLGDKSPGIARGHKAASADPAKVGGMNWHDATGIGVEGGTIKDGAAAGHHLLCVDLDPPKAAKVADGDPALATFAVLLRHLETNGLPHVLTATPSGGSHLWIATDGRVRSGVDVLNTKSEGRCAVDLRGAGGYAVRVGEALYDASGRPTKSRATVSNGGRVGRYETVTEVELGPADLGVVPVAMLAGLGLCGPDGGPVPRAARSAPVAGGEGGAAVVTHPQGTTAAVAPAQRPAEDIPDDAKVIEPFAPPVPQAVQAALPAHLAGAGQARTMTAAQRSDPAEVREALMAAIAGEDLTGNDAWAAEVLLPLAGAVARGSITEAEGWAIFVEVSQMPECGGELAADAEKRWTNALDAARAGIVADPTGAKVMGVGSIFAAAKAAGWVATTGGEGGAGKRKIQPDADTLRALLEASPVTFRQNELTGTPHFTLHDALPGVHLQVGVIDALLDDTAERELFLHLVRVFRAMPGGAASSPLMVNAKLAWATLAARNRFNPLRQRFDELPQWDGIRRAETWLHRHAGAVGNDPYVRALSYWMLRARAMRACYPGCYWPIMPILYGAGGIGKSRMLKVLAFSDNALFTSAKSLMAEKAVDRQAHLAGRLIAEVAELDGMGKRAISELKRLVTETDDGVRKHYSHSVEARPRSVVCIGSANPSATFPHLDDNGRRIAPITLLGVPVADVRPGAAPGAMCTRIDTAAIKAELPQLYAEVLHDMKAVGLDDDGMPQYQLPRELENMTAAQEPHLDDDPVRSAVARVLRDLLTGAPHGHMSEAAILSLATAPDGQLALSVDDLRDCGAVVAATSGLSVNARGKAVGAIMRPLTYNQKDGGIWKSNGRRHWRLPADTLAGLDAN